MEGTSGFADRAPLRGGAQEAALPEGLAQARSPAAGLAQAGSLGGLVKGVRFVHPAGRLLQLPQSVSKKAARATQVQGRNVRRTLCVQRARPTNRVAQPLFRSARSHALATEGARATRSG